MFLVLFSVELEMFNHICILIGLTPLFSEIICKKISWYLFFFREIYDSFLETLEKTGADFTNCFRCLSALPLPGSPDFEKKLKDMKAYLLTQCSTLKEMKIACKTEMDPR